MSDITSAAENAGDRAASASKQLVDSTRQAIADASDYAKGTAQQASDFASGAKDYLQGQCENATDAVSGGLKSAARSIRDATPPDGHVKDAAYNVAQGLSNGANYIDEHGFSGMMGDIATAVRRTPLAALAIGVGIGFLAGLSKRAKD